MQSKHKHYERIPYEFTGYDISGALADTHFGWKQASYLAAIGVSRK
jgi:hypothetical protein